MSLPTNLLDAVRHFGSTPEGIKKWQELCAEKFAELERQNLQLRAQVEDACRAKPEKKPADAPVPAAPPVAENPKPELPELGAPYSYPDKK